MTAAELRYKNRAVYFRKAITAPLFDSESVLTRDPFEFVQLWLTRNCKQALPFWQQAEAYHSATKVLPPISAPLTSYYCFLNCVKALLLVKGSSFSDRHGVAGDWDPTSKRVLLNEVITIQGAGILSSLSDYLGEGNLPKEFTLLDALGNLPYIHRAFRHTYRSKPEIFIPLNYLVYRRHPADPYFWFSAEIKGRFSDPRSLRALPAAFEVDHGFKDRCIIRSKKRYRWHRHGDSEKNKHKALRNLWALHRRMRRDISFISAPVDLWYLKRPVVGSSGVNRSSLVLTLAAMHRLSELSRYDPAGLSQYLDGKVNWLLSEFIRLSPYQFVDEIACELTGLEMRMPGVRPN
ncbi:MAG: YaaC family protein [Kiloniellaceae bacterium]